MSNSFGSGSVRLPGLALVVIAGVAGVAIGCGDTEIKTYRVAKDPSDNPAAHLHNAPMAHSAQRGPMPHIHATTPAGWQQVPAEGMRVASYQVAGNDGRVATVSVIPLPGAPDIQLQSINMWREELEIEPLSSEQEVTHHSDPVQVGDTQGILVDVAGTRAGNNFKSRTVGALAERGGVMWFVKMSGEDKLVAENRDKFVSFLKSIQFHEGSHDEPPAMARGARTHTDELPPESDAPNWKVPEHWSAKAPGPMILSAYLVTGENGEAEVTISKFPGDVGGVSANANRWRGQVGLQPLPEAELLKSVEMLEVDGKKDSYMVDVTGVNPRTGKAARMLTVGVPKGGETWFFKIMGDETVVAREKDAFVRFVTAAF